MHEKGRNNRAYLREERGGYNEEEFYSEESLRASVENDEISAGEEGFMRGWLGDYDESYEEESE